MKFFAVLAFFGVLGVSLGACASFRSDNCDFECTDLDLPVCGHSGMCFNKFQSLCKLEEYNCNFPQKPFIQTDDWKCAERFLPQCTSGDFDN